MEKEVYFCANGHAVDHRSEDSHRAWCKDCDEYVTVKPKEKEKDAEATNYI